MNDNPVNDNNELNSINEKNVFRIKKIDYLKNYNLKAAAAHTVAAIVFGILLFVSLRSDFRKASIYRLKPQVDLSEPVRDTVDRPLVTTKLLNFDVGVWILLFFLFTIAFHLLYAFNSGPGQWYSRYISEGHNPVRWLEYSISAGIMTGIIGALAGVREGNALWTIVLAIVGVMLQGAIVERQLILPVPDKQTVKYAFGTGWVLLLGVWVPITYSLVKVISDVRNSSDDYAAAVPSWIPIFVLVQLYQFARFGLVQWKQVKALLHDMPLPKYTDIEKLYIKESFATKLTLGCFLAYGLLQRQKQSDEWQN